jgi:hypothetical protein
MTDLGVASLAMCALWYPALDKLASSLAPCPAFQPPPSPKQPLTHHTLSLKDGHACTRIAAVNQPPASSRTPSSCRASSESLQPRHS